MKRSIRKAKKAMKNSNGFFTLVIKSSSMFCVNEWDTVKFQHKGISVNGFIYIPYVMINRVIWEGK